MWTNKDIRSAQVTGLSEFRTKRVLPGNYELFIGDFNIEAHTPNFWLYVAFGHHDEIVSEYPYTVLTATGDACSASRPGARRESLDRYIKRMEELESIAHEFNGVEQAFAIQAGREVRVILAAEKVDDQAAAKVCRDIAKRFEEQLTYPGEIKITVIRETRFTELAR